MEHSNRFYHQSCYEERDSGSKDRRELLEYISKLYGEDVAYPLVTKQIKDLVEEYGYSIKGIELTLRYFYEIEGNSLSRSKGIGIVPFAYEDAKKYYNRIVRIQNSVREMDSNNIETQTVYTTPEKPRRKRKKIDIGGI